MRVLSVSACRAAALSAADHPEFAAAQRTQAVPPTSAPDDDALVTVDSFIRRRSQPLFLSE
jgi:hypothetical protein